MTDRLYNLLKKYKKYQDMVDEISKETSAIVATSGIGQAPPVFHRLVQKQLDIIKKNISPIWEELKNFIIPGSRFKSFWQETHWTLGTLPPDYHEIEEILKKYESVSPTKPSRLTPDAQRVLEGW